MTISLNFPNGKETLTSALHRIHSSPGHCPVWSHTRTRAFPPCVSHPMTEFPASESPSPDEGPCCGDENEIINKHVSPRQEESTLQRNSQRRIMEIKKLAFSIGWPGTVSLIRWCVYLNDQHPPKSWLFEHLVPNDRHHLWRFKRGSLVGGSMSLGVDCESFKVCLLPMCCLCLVLVVWRCELSTCYHMSCYDGILFP